MKAIFIIVASFVAVACAAPAGTGKAVAEPDWDAAKIWNKKFGDIIHNVVETINTTALNDTANQAASQKISRELGKANKAAFESLIPIVHGIDDKTLTSIEAFEQFDQIFQILADFMDYVYADIEQLSPSAQETITDAYVAGLEDSYDVSNKVVLALKGRRTIVDWKQAEELVADIQEVMNTSVTSIAKIAVEADRTVGGQIADAVNTAGKDNGAILEEMQKLIKNQTLETDVLFEKLTKIDENLEIAEDKIYDLLSELPGNVIDSILDIMDEARAEMDDIIFDLVDLFEFSNHKKTLKH